MADDANDPDQPTPEAPAQGADTPAETPAEPSLTDELSAAREEDGPETPVEGEDAKPAPESEKTEEPKPTDQEETPAEPVKEEDKPADPPEGEDPDVAKMTKAERDAHFYELRQRQKAASEQDATQKLNAQYQPQAVDELKQHYLDQGRSDFEADMLADRDRRDQQVELAEAKAQVVALNSAMNSEAIQVMHEHPVFDPQSSEYDEEFTNQAIQLYEEFGGVQRDKNTGLALAANVMPKAFYDSIVKLRDTGLSNAQVKAQQNAAQELASVTPKGSSPPPSAAPSGDDAQAKGLEAAFKKV